MGSYFYILILGKEKHRPRTITTEVLEQRAFLSGLRVSDMQLHPKCKSFGSGVGNAAVLPRDETQGGFSMPSF